MPVGRLLGIPVGRLVGMPGKLPGEPRSIILTPAGNSKVLSGMSLKSKLVFKTVMVPPVGVAVSILTGNPLSFQSHSLTVPSEAEVYWITRQTLPSTVSVPMITGLLFNTVLTESVTGLGDLLKSIFVAVF